MTSQENDMRSASLRGSLRSRARAWQPAIFPVARSSGVHDVEGYVYLHLGIYFLPGRKRPTWGLTHLESGHNVCEIVGTVSEAFPIASEIAECGDWSFCGLYGYRNSDPELPAKTLAILDKHSGRASRRDEPDSGSEARAREVMLIREDRASVSERRGEAETINPATATDEDSSNA